MSLVATLSKTAKSRLVGLMMSSRWQRAIAPPQHECRADHEFYAGTRHHATSLPGWHEIHEAAGAVLLAELMQFFMNSLCASPGAIF